jgi:beta-fructofuranosidase
LYVFNNGSETITVENLNAWSMNLPVMNVPIKNRGGENPRNE